MYGQLQLAWSAISAVLSLSLSLCCWLALCASYYPALPSHCSPPARPVSLASMPAKLPRIMRRFGRCGGRCPAVSLARTGRRTVSVCLSVSLPACVCVCLLLTRFAAGVHGSTSHTFAMHRSCALGSRRGLCADVAVAGEYDRSSTHRQYQCSVHKHHVDTC